MDFPADGNSPHSRTTDWDWTRTESTPLKNIAIDTKMEKKRMLVKQWGENIQTRTHTYM